MTQLESFKYFQNQITKSPNYSLFQYLKCLRFYFKWRYFLTNPSKTPFSESIPWMNFETIKYLEKIITSEFKIFEFGGGGSTKFFVQRSSFLHTTEHDKDWYLYFTKDINVDSSKWESELHAPMFDISQKGKSISNPLDYYSDDSNFREHNFRDYATSILKYQDNYFDLVLVDGRVRPSCMYHSFSKIKSGGYLCLDNSERSYYLNEVNQELLESFEMVNQAFGPIPSTPDFSQTTIWKKK